MKGKIAAYIVLLCVPFMLGGQVKEWEGAGAGGTSNLWSEGANWDPSGVPGLGDAVNVTFTEESTPDYGLLVAAGAEAGAVMFGGLDRSENRQVLFLGDATFDSFWVNFTGTGVQIQDLVELDGTLDILGGSAGTPSLRWGPFGATRSPLLGTGTIRFHADDVFLNIAAHSLYNLEFLSEEEGATIDFMGTQLAIGGSLGVRSTQTLVGLSGGIYLSGGAIVSLDGQPLDNFSGVDLVVGRHSQSGGVTVADLAAGTYGSMRITNAHNGNNSQTIRLAGDINLDSTVTVDAGDGDAAYTLLLNRFREGSANYGELRTDGYDLTTVGTGVGRFQVGNPVVGDPVEQSNNFIDLSSGPGGNTTMHIEGDFGLGSNGYLIAPDPAVLILESNFESVSGRNTLFNGTGLSLRMQGSGTSLSPQELELPGADLGTHDPGDPFANNFYMGELVIGVDEVTSTWVDLVNHYSFNPGGDALYVGSLLVNEGSVLALNGLSLYVDGVLVEPGDTQYGDGLIVIPEPGLAVVILGLGLLAFRRRGRTGG